MPATLVQSQKAFLTTAATSISLTLGSTPTPGNLLVAVLTTSNFTGSPVPPWGSSVDVTSSGNALVRTLIYSHVAGSSESTTVGFSCSNTNEFSLTVMEFAPSSGKAWAGLDKSVATTTSTPSQNTLTVGPTATLTNADDVAVVGIATTNVGFVTPSFTNSYTLTSSTNNATRGLAGYSVLSSTTATSTTGSWEPNFGAQGALATYLQNSAAAPQNAAFLALL